MSASSELWPTTMDEAVGDVFGEWPAVSSSPRGPLFVSIQAASSPLYERRKLQPEPMDVILGALKTDAVAKRILAKGQQLEVGQCIGVRLNLNVLKNTGVAVHTIHRATSADGHTKGRGFYRGEVIAYQPVVVLKDAYFNVHQKMRQDIGAGIAAKGPMASADGTYQLTDASLSFDGVLLRFNPKREHLFTDEEGFAVQYAEHVTIMGHRAYARGTLRYFTSVSAPVKTGSAPSLVRFKL